MHSPLGLVQGPATLQGTVVPGKHLGTRLGFPTANLSYQAVRSLEEKDGVYIALARLNKDKHLYPAILNQGRHPTAPTGQPTIEVHLLGYRGGDLYGSRLSLWYQRFLRPEAQFPSLEALRAQLALDQQAALAWAKEKGLPVAPEGEPMASKSKKGKRENATVAPPPQFQYPVEAVEASYQYEEEGSPAVNGISLAVEKGAFVAVLGHNGSGKSTLAKLMNALFLPTQGQVLVCGMDTAREEHLWEVRKHAGMVFQNPDNQIVATVVREDVAFGLENLGIPQPEMLPRIDQALRAVRMTDFAALAPHMLSGGQKQRVAIAGVLAMAPDVMVLDEATAMLDPSGRAEVLDTVRKLNRDQGITVVWITHFMEEAALADRVVVLHKGAIALDGPPAQVFTQVDTLQALGLDVPPMAQLAQDLRQNGLPLPDGILTVPQMVKELKNILCPSK